MSQVSDWPPNSLPWAEPLERRLHQLIEAGRMPHAICLEGPAGVGKGIVVERLIGMLLCSDLQPSGPCGSCAECLLLRAGSHPDRIQVVPDTKTGRTISVDAVRALIERISMRPQRQGAQIAVLTPADALNAASANALLKTLEEPAQDSHLVLICADPARLPVTVLSRCLRLVLNPPSADVAIDWLQRTGSDDRSLGLALELADGRPLLALGAAQGGRLTEWEAAIRQLAALQSGRTGIVESALSMAKSPDASLEVLQRVLEAALDLALGGSKFTRLREQLHLTSQVEESTLQSVWLRCKRARQELGSGLRDDLSLASLLLGVAGALRWQAVG
ncbi:MAG: DNA polymerase III subunit delta' [Xanthomonadales bacterium]|nr:DNA polymerase III subunit delta' [Xanthomonadales bacterium]